MISHQLIIAPAAQNDLKDIYRYGLRNWDYPSSSTAYDGSAWKTLLLPNHDYG
jgi:plasmid stabilization system protein ParE